MGHTERNIVLQIQIANSLGVFDVRKMNTRMRGMAAIFAAMAVATATFAVPAGAENSAQTIAETAIAVSSRRFR